MPINPNDLLSRDAYQTSSPDVEGMTRASLTLHSLLRGVPLEEPIKKADMLHIQSINLQEEERSQVTVDSADDGKVYLFGRQPRIYTVSGFLVDSNGEPNTHLLSEWLDLYENHFRLTKCYEDNTIARLKWRTSEFWGCLISNVRSMESTNQNLAIVSFTFAYFFGSEDVAIPYVGVSDRVFPAMLSREGYVSMVGHLAVEKAIVTAKSAVSKAMEGRRSVPVRGL